MRTFVCSLSPLLFGTSRFEPVAEIPQDSGTEKWAPGKFGSWKVLGMLLVFCAATAPGLSAQTLTTLYNFCSQSFCADGGIPSASLVQATDGNFYGTASVGGTGGTVFRITPSGSLTTLYTFCSLTNCTDG